MTTDPFESLREPLAPLAPSADFAARLRRRLVEVLDPRHEERTMPDTSEYTPTRLHTVTPYLACKGADRALEWYQDVFDAELLGPPVIMDNGAVGHAELRFGDTVVFIADEWPPEDVLGPDTLGGNSVGLMLHVPDSTATFQRALAAGATQVRPVSVAYGARTGVLRDPFGHRWFVSTAVEPDS